MRRQRQAASDAPGDAEPGIVGAAASRMPGAGVLGQPGARSAFALQIGLALARAACIVCWAWALASCVARLVAGAAAVEVAAQLAAFVACFTLAQALACAQEACAARYARRRVEDMRRALLNAVFSGAGRLPARWQTGTLVEAATEGLDAAEGYLRLCLPRLAALFGTGLPLLVAVFACDAISGVVLAIALPTIVLFMVMLGREAAEKAGRSRAAFERMGNSCVDALFGVETLVAFDAQKREEARLFSTSEDLRHATVDTLKTATLSHAVLDAVATFAVAGVAMLLATRLLDGTMGLETALLVLLLAPQVLAPVRALATDFHATLDGQTALAAIEGVVVAGEEGTAGEGGAVDEGGAIGAHAGDRAGEQDVSGDEGAGAPACGTTGEGGGDSAWGADSTLRVEGLRFAYPPADDGGGAADAPCTAPALTDVSFTLHGFERIALLGASGAGKSTLASLLAGIACPDAGAFTLDGRPLFTLQGASWRSNVLYIPQNPHVFSASVRDNVAFYMPDAPRQAVEQAIERAGLAEFVAGLPQGLDTRIGDGGRGLSGGQAQRIALARAFLDERRRVLVLDEPTAHLDIETELELKERMRPLMEGRLVVFSTHRLHWLADMDRVLVLDAGRVAGVCTCDELRDATHPLHSLVFGGHERGGDAHARA